MPRFFIPAPINTKGQHSYTLTGPDAAHIAGSLRMKPGEEITLCAGDGLDHRCALVHIAPGEIEVKLLETLATRSEPELKLHLFQCLPKGDKMEWVVQKAVELGIESITPVLSARCVSRPDAKTIIKKADRWQKIAMEAAKQSGRGIIPIVNPMLHYTDLLQRQQDRLLIFYERGQDQIRETVDPTAREISLLIGSEGGFDQQEINAARKSGAKILSLGPRILRTETAPLAAISILMYHCGEI